MSHTRSTRSIPQPLNPLSLQALNKLQQEIFDVLQAYRNKGVANMTGAEIRDAWEVVHAPARLDKGTVSARLAELVKLGRVARSPDIRACRAYRPEGVKPSTARPVFIAMQGSAA